MSEQSQEEWTPEYVGSLVGGMFNGAWRIAEAHNAALAAEREKWEALAATQFDLEQRATDWCAKSKELEQQLAAEREKVEGYRRYALRVEGTCKTGGASQLMIVSHQLGLADKENFGLRQQLAAEREKPRTTEYAQGWDDHIAAARAERKLLVDMLISLRRRIEGVYPRDERLIEHIDALASGSEEPTARKAKEAK